MSVCAGDSYTIWWIADLRVVTVSPHCPLSAGVKTSLLWGKRQEKKIRFCSLVGGFLQDLEMSWWKGICAVLQWIVHSSQVCKWVSSLFYFADARGQGETRQGSASHDTDLLLSSQMTHPSSFWRDLEAQSDYQASRWIQKFDWSAFFSFSDVPCKTVKKILQSGDDEQLGPQMPTTEGLADCFIPLLPLWHQNTLIYSSP